MTPGWTDSASAREEVSLVRPERNWGVNASRETDAAEC